MSSRIDEIEESRRRRAERHSEITQANPAQGMDTSRVDQIRQSAENRNPANKKEDSAEIEKEGPAERSAEEAKREAREARETAQDVGDDVDGLLFDRTGAGEDGAPGFRSTHGSPRMIQPTAVGQILVAVEADETEELSWSFLDPPELEEGEKATPIWTGTEWDWAVRKEFECTPVE